MRLSILGSSPCHLCHAACCKQNGHEFAAILEPDEIPRFRAFSVTAAFELNGTVRTEHVLPYVGGRCQFLGEDDLCTIYEDRPRACRAFECVPHFNRHGVGEHGIFLQRNPRVLAMLESL